MTVLMAHFDIYHFEKSVHFPATDAAAVVIVFCGRSASLGLCRTRIRSGFDSSDSAHRQSGCPWDSRQKRQKSAVWYWFVSPRKYSGSRSKKRCFPEGLKSGILLPDAARSKPRQNRIIRLPRIGMREIISDGVADKQQTIQNIK